MKQLLYISFENAKNRASGVNKKIDGQIKAFEARGFKVSLIARYDETICLKEADKETIIPNPNKTGLRKLLTSWVIDNCAGIDCVYIRFQFFCPWIYSMLKKLHHKGVRCVMEIPTYPYIGELKRQGLHGVPKYLCDSIYKRISARYIDSFAVPVYSGEVLGRPCIEIRNGISIDEVAPKNARAGSADDPIKLLAVAMMAPWHGYDRVIEGLNRYYNEQEHSRTVELHLVGEGVATSDYNLLIEKYGLQKYVIQHGRLSGADLSSMYDQCNIGVASLGIHRIGIYKTNTLKTLEYVAKGLPIVCEDGETILENDTQYRLTMPWDDTPVDIASVVKFYEKLTQKEDEFTLIENIREKCRKTCSVEVGMKAVIDFLLGK